MNLLIKKLLENRGLTKQYLEEINNPEYELLQNIDNLCAHLHNIHEKQIRIVVLPDYDMDGIMSGVVGKAGLAALGFKYELFIPNPKEGYGFGKKQVDRLVRSFPDVGAIITCDTGISCVEGVTYAHDEYDIEVLITDHHKESLETTPREIATAVVDPCGLDETYEHPAICGAFVLWQVLDRYAELYGSEIERERIKLLRAFAAVGTISDVMPVLYENRQLIRDGVEIWKGFWRCDKAYTSLLDDAPEDFANAFRGIFALCRDFGEAGKIKSVDALTEEFFGFYLAPTFNAIKRMDGELKTAFDVFMGGNQRASIAYLMELNEKRKEAVNEAFTKLMEQENPYAPYVYITDALPGLLGLLAMKCLGKTGMPCVVVGKIDRTDEEIIFSGSGRAPGWYPFLSRREAGGISGHMAGHEGAFGCSFTETELMRLYTYMKTDVKEIMDKVIEEMGELETVEYDIIISDDGTGDAKPDQTLFLEFLEELESLRPFGVGFPAPSVLLEFDGVEATYNTIGSDKSHLKITLSDGLNILCWSQASFIDNGLPEGRVKVVGMLSTNEFRGNVSAQFAGDIVS